jgi:predicted phosphoserine aminotransferase
MSVHSVEKPPQKLFIPGPTDVLPQVLEAQAAPMIGHRTSEFEEMFARCESQMKQLYFTDSRVYIVASSGTGMQEAAVRNCVGGRVINFVNGAFSQRWHDVSVGCGKATIRVDVPWCTAVKPEHVADALQAALDDGPVDAITVVHNETSTGVTSPVGEIAATVREISPDTLILVDAVSSFSGVKIPVDEWGLDVCLTSSQKALAVPPGLAFAAVSDRALERAQSVEGRGWYFDFLMLEKYLARNTTPATPAISLIRALSAQLDIIFQEGLENRFARHAHLRSMTQDWALARGFGLMAEAGYRSPTVTTIENTHGIDISDLNRYLGSQNMQISNGYGPYKGKAFRIGHMGEVQERDLRRLFDAMDAYLERQGITW